VRENMDDDEIRALLGLPPRKKDNESDGAPVTAAAARPR